MTTGTASASDIGGALAAPVRAGELVAEKYQVEETLGVGGMGVVVAARDAGLERRVAIKFLLPRLAGSETAVQRFVREARAATRITSEHVVRLLEIDKLPNGTPFFVMEYLEGRDLRALLRDNGALPPSVAVDYLLQALQAVAEGHLKGIVHRDIKPGNLFRTARADGTPLIKVLDFGIAKRLEREGSVEESSLTSSDDVRLGSPAYMPPEQLQDPRDVDTRSDIWSLGATLHELVTGKPPFEGPGYLELVSRILTSPLKPISNREPTLMLPSGLEAVLRKCLEKDRTLRYANALELAIALAPFGSEDAQVSLARVTGLHASAPSVVTPAHAIEPAGSCTTTLPVAGESYSSRRAAAASPSASSGTRRSWVVVLGAVSVVAVALAFRSFLVPVPAPAVSSVTAARPISVGPASPQPRPEPRAAVPAVAVPTVVAPAAAEVVPVSVTPKPAKPKSATGAASPAAMHVETPEPRAVATASRAPTQPVLDAQPVPLAEPAAGRSEEIERLIESRR